MKMISLIQIALKSVPRNLIDSKPALFQVMAWHWTSDKPLTEPMLAQFTNIYVALAGDELVNFPCCLHINFHIS